jgi:hypothetical protein
MSHAQALAAVRGHVAEAFHQHRLADGSEPRESILLKSGIYCGRRFEVGTGFAMWNYESDELKVYTINGKLLEIVAGASMERVEMRKAA